MFAKVKDFIFELIEFLMLQPHAFTGWAVIDLDLVPNCRRELRPASRTFHFVSALVRPGAPLWR
jgi:hypothetical protein